MGDKKKTLVLCQSVVPHYRKFFMDYLNDNYDFHIYLYGHVDEGLKDLSSEYPSTRLKWFSLFGLTIFQFFNKKLFLADYVVVQGNVRHLSNLFVLAIRKVLGLPTIVFGHGISGKNYVREVNKNINLKGIYYQLFDLCWFYTPDIREYWNKSFWRISSISLYNTQSFNYPQRRFGAIDAKMRYAFVTSTRFNIKDKRGDELISFWENYGTHFSRLDIIGTGDCLPVKNIDKVYYHGNNYDAPLKRRCFHNANFYIQLGALGLSIVEAFYNGLPIITLRRSMEVHHGVEYAYLKNDFNAIIVNSIDEIVVRLATLKKIDYLNMCNNAFITYEKIHPEKMASRAEASLKKL